MVIMLMYDQFIGSDEPTPCKEKISSMVCDLLHQFHCLRLFVVVVVYKIIPPFVFILKNCKECQ